MNYNDILEDDYREDVWYPDDSGLWIETYNQKFILPDNCKAFGYLLNKERILQKYPIQRCYAKIIPKFFWNDSDYQFVCAIKIFYK